MEGDSVTLHTSGTEIHEDEDMLWKFAKIRIENQIFVTSDGPDGRFRHRLKLDNQTGSLTITNITPEHAGVYELEINGPISSACSYHYQRLFIIIIILFIVVFSGECGKQFIVQHHLSLPLEVEYQDKNTYSCVINNPISNQTQHLDISKLCQPCP
ncbi:hypothetical protein M9458_055216, partial [Cirrhinus mrigala]